MCLQSALAVATFHWLRLYCYWSDVTDCSIIMNAITHKWSSFMRPWSLLSRSQHDCPEIFLTRKYFVFLFCLDIFWIFDVMSPGRLWLIDVWSLVFGTERKWIENCEIWVIWHLNLYQQTQRWWIRMKPANGNWKFSQRMNARLRK